MSEELRNEILRVFRAWDDSEMTAQAVQNWAMRTSSASADDCAKMVMTHLRSLGEYLITTDDLKLYRQALGLRSPEDGVRFLREAAEEFDVKQRATELQHDQFYGPHTRAILKDLKK
ncbi:MAG: hypothetical protein IT462_06305 [Planctomycetes bacterium]|nr:hypothetical protein [Planctomycetota bacterium]